MISDNINVNKENVKEIFNNTSDLVLYEFETLSNEKALIVYIDGIIDETKLDEDVLKPLTRDLVSIHDIRSTVHISKVKEIRDIKDTTMPIFQGGVVLFIEGLDIAYVFNLSQWTKRKIEQPATERVIRGSKESFVEDIVVNRTLIRREIMNENLVFENYILGEQTNTAVSLVYMDGIVKEEILEDLRNRIKEIKVDLVLDTGNIESYISENTSKIVSTIGLTERADTVAGKILEGRIAILCDGSPSALTVPKLFIETLHTTEDYYINPIFATFLRLMRTFALFMSFTLPSIYVSLILYHQEMIPTELLMSIAGQREGVPLGTSLEALLLILFFDLLREATLRIPQALGEAVILVGGLVIGDAAVNAGVVSATMIIVVAVTGVSEFVVSKFREEVPILRIIFLFLGSILGLYGVSFGLIFLIIDLISLDSFGVPYMWPLAPYDRQGIKDTILKTPLQKLEFRPEIMSNKDARKRR